MLKNESEEIEMTSEWRKYRMAFFKGIWMKIKEKTDLLKERGKKLSEHRLKKESHLYTALKMRT